MRVLFCSSEIYPYIKTGGLGDVAAALPPALAQEGVDMRLFLPGHKNILARLEQPETLIAFPVYFGAHDVRILKGTLNGLVAYALDAPEFWHRDGLYVDANGVDWPDNAFRFAALCRAAADLPDYDPEWQAEIIHGNDWQCGLIPVYVRQKPGAKPATLITIHNIAYQGLFSPSILPLIGFPASDYHLAGGEFYGKLGYLKSGLAFAGHITTVSPTYAREIQETDQGCGLQDFLKTKAGHITGIINGIDTEVWNPETDPDVPHPFSKKKLKNRDKNKALLLSDFKLDTARNKPLFAVISRLGYQKGFDLLLDAAPYLIEKGGNLLVLGSGDKDLEDGFKALAAAHPQNVAVHIGYDEPLAHKIQAGADVIAMPSRSEPCGLVQLYAMRYGALPFVRRTGGLADTVADGATGFVFDGDAPAAVRAKIDDIFAAYNSPEKWAAMQAKGMEQDVSWSVPAKEYKALYNTLLTSSKNS